MLVQLRLSAINPNLTILFYLCQPKKLTAPLCLMCGMRVMYIMYSVASRWPVVQEFPWRPCHSCTLTILRATLLALLPACWATLPVIGHAPPCITLLHQVHCQVLTQATTCSHSHHTRPVHQVLIVPRSASIPYYTVNNILCLAVDFQWCSQHPVTGVPLQQRHVEH